MLACGHVCAEGVCGAVVLVALTEVCTPSHVVMASAWMLSPGPQRNRESSESTLYACSLRFPVDVTPRFKSPPSLAWTDDYDLVAWV